VKKAFEMFDKADLEMPIIMDYSGTTPFDRVLGVHNLSEDSSLFMNTWK
jgi:hypothetical protein